MSYVTMVTAHRDLAPEDHVKIYTIMDQEVSNPEVEKIYFGGAFGGDTVALQASLKARLHRINFPKLVVVLPKTLKKQRTDLQEITKQADEIIELKLSRKIYNDIWWEHDKWMVDHADRCLSFFDGIEAGGTYNAMKYAENQGKTVTIIDLIGRNYIKE